MTEQADEDNRPSFDEEVIAQQDAVRVEACGDTLAISQTWSFDGSESRICISGVGNIDALISSLQKAREVLQ